MKVLLGVTGGIAAYKAANLVRAFVKRGDEVRVVMTRGAQEFITPLTLQILSENRVGVDLWDATFESEIGHIDLARWPDVILVAPATAHVIAKLANGMADDLLTTLLLATTSPVVIAPAMNTQMYLHPRVQANMKLLRDELGYSLVTPGAGELACKEVGPGRLPDPPILLAGADRAVRPQVLAGKKVLVTAGPTREHIDPARFISNPSSGKMGYALAEQAFLLGAQVTLVSGPSALGAPVGVELVSVTTAQHMYDAVMSRAAEQDYIVKAAAVADWRPAAPSDKKRSKSDMSGVLELTRNPDILATLGEQYGPGADNDGPTIVGFAAESHDVEARGIAKLARKKAHWLVANKIGGAGSSFGSSESSASLIHHDSSRGLRRFGPAPKQEIAGQIWRAIAAG